MDTSDERLDENDVGLGVIINRHAKSSYGRCVYEEAID